MATRWCHNCCSCVVSDNSGFLHDEPASGNASGCTLHRRTSSTATGMSTSLSNTVTAEDIVATHRQQHVGCSNSNSDVSIGENILVRTNGTYKFNISSLSFTVTVLISLGERVKHAAFSLVMTYWMQVNTCLLHCVLCYRSKTLNVDGFVLSHNVCGAVPTHLFTCSLWWEWYSRKVSLAGKTTKFYPIK